MRYRAMVTGVCMSGFLVACGPVEDDENDNNEGNGEETVTLVQPDSAEASSKWSDSYAIDFVIDGSGLPSDFGPNDAHDAYTGSNHWTTSDGEVEGAWARFSFDAPVTINTFWMWNHLSTSPPAYSDGYAVTLFDLEFLDADGESIAELTGLTAEPDVKTSQVFSFEKMEDVSAVLLTIQENNGEPEVTGLAEVLFGMSE